MKRRYAVVYLLFLLCLFLFPPWSIGPRSLQNASDSIAGSCRGLDHQWWDPYPIPASCGDLGHHWRFAIPRFQQTLTANDDLYWTLPSALSEWQVTEAEVPKTRESLESYSTESLATAYPKSPAGSPDYDAVVHTGNMVYESLIALILVALAALLERPILALIRTKADHRRHEADMDKAGAKAAKEMEGHVRFFGVENDPVTKVLSEVFQKSARRKVN